MTHGPKTKGGRTSGFSPSSLFRANLRRDFQDLDILVWPTFELGSWLLIRIYPENLLSVMFEAVNYR
ncbi:hypothetical protein N8T08_009001 [Aspergillus melleus]|uniref:Uncharacterized protein n=1 Tax=Aspergillus melleus TaxID=138277 RepID=A0ACC3AV08_9EURO|nr:hypothetical protein N8T08_009001 [Aspergillus melleus]